MSNKELNVSLQEFSLSWESYVENCKRSNYSAPRYYPIKDHPIHLLLKNKIKEEFKTLLDERIYSVESSDGKGQLAGIPWISVMDKNVTTSTQRGFYISYLFSRNAKKLHLSIALGATQFEELYGANKKTTNKIQSAKNRFVNNFVQYSPIDQVDEMNLKNEEDENFSRKFSKEINRIADYYKAGSFFTKSYDVQQNNFLNQDLDNDLAKYVNSYRKIVSDPSSDLIIDMLDEIVHEESDVKNKNLDYEIQKFNPAIQDSEVVNKNQKKQQSSKRKYTSSTPTKKVGDAGENYVYDFEVNKLTKIGRKDLAKQIVKQYEDKTEFPGYDIQSFDLDGNEIFIEVKSTKGKKNQSFDISVNELNAAKRLENKFHIYLVVNALTDPHIAHVISNPISLNKENMLKIEPVSYNISFKLVEDKNG